MPSCPGVSQAPIRQGRARQGSRLYWQEGLEVSFRDPCGAADQSPPGPLTRAEGVGGTEDRGERSDGSQGGIGCALCPGPTRKA